MRGIPRLLLRLVPVVLLGAAGVVHGGEAERIRVLSYNVHGFWMPGHPLGSDERSLAIGALLGDYDVIALQEDWEYHDLLAAGFPYRIVERGNGARDHWALTSTRILTYPVRWFSTRSRMPYGSGLTILARDLEPVADEVTREYLGACNGWLRYGNDCLASKGFLRVRVRLPSGREIDLYDTHLDAGPDEADREARREQLRRWAERIAALSADRALIVAGDFNSQYFGADGSPRAGEDSKALSTFTRSLGLEDSLAAPAEGSAWDERIDYILVRSSEELEIRVVESGEDRRFARDGHPLSDHPAVFAELELREPETKADPPE